MKQIYDITAVQVLPCQNGFIFVLKSEEDEKSTISYKYLDLERMTFAASTRKVYLLTKFGNRFENFDESPEHYLGVQTVFLPDYRLLVCKPDGEAFLFGGDGELRFSGWLTYDKKAPYHVVLGDDCLWASYPEEGAVVQFGLHNLRPKLRIGGGSSRLPMPSGLMYQHGKLLFCSPSEKKIYELDPVQYDLEEYHAFDQPVYRYYKYHSHELVQLQDGIYKL